MSEKVQTFLNTMGKVIKEQREERGITREQLAKKRRHDSRRNYRSRKR